jgi:hypothetical protein
MAKDLKTFFNQYLRQVDLPVVHARQSGNNITLTLQGYDDALKLPVYYQGRFIAELSKAPVTIAVKDLPALLNYMIVYIPYDSGTMPLVR